MCGSATPGNFNPAAIAKVPTSLLVLAISMVKGNDSPGAILLTAAKAIDTPGMVVAVAGGLAAVFLLVRGALSDRRAAYAFFACAVSVVTGAVLGLRVPLYEPDVYPTGKRPSVLLITIDTLRADHVGAYGYKNARTPNLDALAACGVMFRQTVTANVHTGPSHATMLTGLGFDLNQKLAQSVGADDYITKPFSEQELLGTIAKFIQMPK